MYFPYLRGRQNELLALRDLLEKERISKKIIPIIEPIKFTSTFVNAISLFNKNKNPIVLIRNPQVGGFVKELLAAKNDAAKDDTAKAKIKDIFETMIIDENLISAYVLDKRIIDEIRNGEINGLKIQKMLVVANNIDIVNEHKEIFTKLAPKYSLIPDERLIKRTFKQNKIILDDKFNKMDRNADYSKNDDEFFSDDHLFFQEEGYIGFSDYSIVGENFTESGFAPHSVAIHIVYFDNDNNLRIKHFISDSNTDASNPAKKFSEALRKLAEWQESMQLDTYGMELLMEHYKNGTYPGLGSIKKLSIMHHLELMSNFLDGVV